MAVRDAQRKAADSLATAGEKLGEGFGRARERFADGLDGGTKRTGKQLRVAREAAGERLRSAAGRTGKGLKAAGETAGDRLKVAGDAGGKRLKVAGDVAGKRLKAARKRSGTAVKGGRRKVGYWIAGEKPSTTRRKIGLGLLAAGAGAAAAFFLDPVSGKRRRHVARDWTAARARAVAERSRRGGRFVGAKAYGAVQSVRHRREAGAPESDQVLAHKVESELFQGTDLPKGQININAENGVVVLRGQVDRPELVNSVESKVRGIQGVREVENLLHTPGTPAPTHR